MLFRSLGSGNTVSTSSPVAVKAVGGTGNLTGVTQVAAGTLHTCALTNAGSVVCWGSSLYDQIGAAGSRSNPWSNPTPVGISGLGAVRSIGAGAYHTCAALRDGSAQCWGFNSLGQLGHGDRSNRTAPRRVDGLKDQHVRRVAAGGRVSLFQIGRAHV